MAVGGTAAKTTFTTSFKSASKNISKKILPDSIRRGIGFNFKTASKGLSKTTSKANKEILEKALAATVTAQKESAEVLAKRTGTSLSKDFTENITETTVKKIDVFKGPIDLPVKATVKATADDVIENTATAATKSSSNLLRNGAMVLGAGGLTALGAYVFLNDKQKGKQIGTKLNDTNDDIQQVAKENTQQPKQKGKLQNNQMGKQTKTYIIIGVMLFLIIMLFYLILT